MPTNASMSFESHVEVWEARRLSTGRAIDAYEHAAILSMGELLSRARLPVDTPTELVELVRRHQNDPVGGMKALAARMGVHAIELELYRRCWRDVLDAAFDRLLQERAAAMEEKGLDGERIRRHLSEITGWRDRLLSGRVERERRREERRVEETRRQAAEPPPWQADLQRYLALRDALAARPAPRRNPQLRPDGCLMDGRPLLNPVHALAVFEWPVQRIGPRYRRRQADGLPVSLVLFRNAIGGIDHLVIGPQAEALLATLARRRVNGRRLVADLAAQFARESAGEAGSATPQPDLAGLRRGLALLLEQFRARGLVLGSVCDNRAP